MPAKSKAQARFMHSVAGGYLKKPGLSKVEAREFVSGQEAKELPEYVRKNKGLRRLMG